MERHNWYSWHSSAFTGHVPFPVTYWHSLSLSQFFTLMLVGLLIYFFSFRFKSFGIVFGNFNDNDSLCFIDKCLTLGLIDGLKLCFHLHIPTWDTSVTYFICMSTTLVSAMTNLRIMYYFGLKQPTVIFFLIWRISVVITGPLIPLFWTFGDAYPLFQSQFGLPGLRASLVSI